MGETTVLKHIRSWETAGLIDEPTAERLRAAEAEETALPAPELITGHDTREVRALTVAPVATAPARLRGLAAGLSPVEVLVGLGVALLVAAWYWELSSRAPAFGQARSAFLAVGTAIPAVLAAVAGLAARERPDGVGGAAGLLLLASGLQVAFAGYFVMDVVRPGAAAFDLTAAAILWAATAALFRRLQPGAPTAAGLVTAVVVAAGFSQGWLQEVIFGSTDWAGEAVGGLVAPGPLIPFLAAAWWVATALVVAVVGEVELRSSDPGGARRGWLVRLVAGCVAVLGLAGSLLGTGWPAGAGMTDRLDPLIGDLAVLGLAAGLVALAGGRRTDAWLYPAALGIVLAVSDLNARRLADGLGMAPALLVEGATLIGVGVATEALRRRLAGVGRPEAATRGPS